MITGYGQGITVPEGQRLVHPSEQIKEGDTFMADVLDEPMPVEATVGLIIADTPFIAVFRKEPCSTS